MSDNLKVTYLTTAGQSTTTFASTLELQCGKYVLDPQNKQVKWVVVKWDQQNHEWLQEKTPPAPEPAEPTENEWGEVCP